MKPNPYSRVSRGSRPTSSRSAKRVPKKRMTSNRRNENKSSRLAVRKRSRFASRRDEELFDERGDFNPQRYEHNSDEGSIRRAVGTRNRYMFNNAGEINADNNRDALLQIKHLLGSVTKQNADSLSMYSPDSAAEKMSKEARRDILAAALTDRSNAGWHIVGQELALPIKQILDYEGFARKWYRVRDLAQGELFRIPVDIRSVAWVVGQDGQVPESRIKSKWITPKEDKIVSYPSVDIADIYHLNFDVLDRAQDTARQEIELQEDKLGILLADAASTAQNTVTTYASLGITALEDVRYQVERWRLMVEKFFINRAELSDIVKTMSSAVDPVTERELILAGHIGNVLNSQILTAAGTGVQEVIPAGTFYASTGSDNFGEMGVRMELFSEPFNKFAQQETVKGWAFCEMVGFGCANSKAVAKGVK